MLLARVLTMRSSREMTTARFSGEAKLLQATLDERERCALVAALHSQYPVTTDYDRGYDKARADAAAEIRRGQQ